MDLDLYDDSIGGLISQEKGMIARDDIFVRAGSVLHRWYRGGIEDALAYYFDGAIYLVNSKMNGEDLALKFTENTGVKDRPVDEILVECQSDEKADVTVKCLNSFSGRFFG